MTRRARPRARLACLAPLLVLTTLQTLQAREAAPSEQVLRAVDFARQSATGGIQEAIDACGSGGYTAPAGCRIVLPRGATTITRTIRIGSTPEARCPGPGCSGRSGIVIEGHASGFETTQPADKPTAGSTLRWKGPAGGAMLQLFGVQYFRLQDFALDGDEGDDGDAAGTGIEIFGDNEVSRPSHGGLIENLYVTDIRDPDPWEAPDSGMAIWIHGAGKNTDQDQVDEIKMLRVEAREVTECLRIESSQAVMDSWTGGTCAQFERYGFGILAGSLLLVDTYVGQSRSAGAPARLVGVFLGPRVSFVTIRDNHFETYAGDSIRSAETGSPGYHTLIEGNSFLMLGDPDKKDAAKNAAFVRYLAPRRITLLANTFLTDSGDKNTHADLRFETEDPNGLGVLLAGNTWTAGHVHVRAAGTRVSVLALDSFLSQRDPSAGASSVDLLNTGIVVPGEETITWRNGDEDVFRLQRHGAELRILDAQDRVLARLAGGTLAVAERVSAGSSLAVGGAGAGTARCLALDSAGRLFVDGDCDGERAPAEESVERKTGSERYGPALWAAAGTSGTDACAAQGLACVDAFVAGSAGPTACSRLTGIRFVRCR